MMTEQEKQLLLVTLCSMLPYGVVVKAIYKDGDGWKSNNRKLLGVYQHDGQVYLNGVYTSINNVKPYLRPMSSMTEEEREKLCEICTLYTNDGDASTYEYWGIEIVHSSRYGIVFENNYSAIDWLNERHFDYRGLIPMGLALEATEGMYNT